MYVLQYFNCFAKPSGKRSKLFQNVLRFVKPSRSSQSLLICVCNPHLCVYLFIFMGDSLQLTTILLSLYHTIPSHIAWFESLSLPQHHPHRIAGAIRRSLNDSLSCQHNNTSSESTTPFHHLKHSGWSALRLTTRPIARTQQHSTLRTVTALYSHNCVVHIWEFSSTFSEFLWPSKSLPIIRSFPDKHGNNLYGL